MEHPEKGKYNILRGTEVVYDFYKSLEERWQGSSRLGVIIFIKIPLLSERGKLEQEIYLIWYN